VRRTQTGGSAALGPYSKSKTNKLYSDGNGPEYTYTADGKLSQRTWARGITTDYTYDIAGSLTNVVYSDETPDVAYTYDRLGLVGVSPQLKR
jgi:YD repeat-containing protein